MTLVRLLASYFNISLAESLPSHTRVPPAKRSDTSKLLADSDQPPRRGKLSLFVALAFELRVAQERVAFVRITGV